MSNISNYFEFVAQELMSNYKRIESLIPSKTEKSVKGTLREGSVHPGEEGRFLESVIRSFLNKYLPKNLRALTGFILRPAASVGKNNTQRLRNQEGDLYSSQLDIIVFDVANYPIFEQYGDFAIVPPEGVYAIISVKKKLYMNQLEEELSSLSFTASLCGHFNQRRIAQESKHVWNQRVAGPITALIGFKSNFTIDDSTPTKVFDKIKTIQSGNPVDGLIKMICSIEDFSFIRGDARKRQNFYRVPYLWIDHHKDTESEPRMNIGLQYLVHYILMLYYNESRTPLMIKPGFNNLEDVTKQNRTYTGRLDIKDEHF